jgi:acetyltransferase
MEKMFYPESVAVVGASSNPNNIGRNIVQNLITWEYGGKVFPVNPRGEDVLGIKGYASLGDIPEGVDLAVAFVPAGAVPGVMDDCAKKGISYMAIPSGGFGEMGGSGAELTSVIKEKAEKYGIRFVGPNGLTITNAENGLCLSFVTLDKRPPGTISIISQSGGVGISLIMFLDDAGSTFNKFVSVGNKVDMDEIDFLEYLGGDPGTKVICMFLESVVRGRRFFKVASAIEKPVLVYKASTTEVGATTAASHTAALANDDTVLEGVFEQAGVIRVGAIRELMDAARAFSLPPMRGNNIAIVSQAGGYTVLTADRAYGRGFSFPQFSNEMLDDFREHVRSDVIRLGNPLDLGDIHSTDAIVYALDQVMAQDYVDGVIAVLLRRADARYDGAYSGLSREVYGDISEIMKKYDKPVALALITQCRYFRDVQCRMDYPVFDSPEVAVEALAVLREYYRRRPA